MELSSHPSIPCPVFSHGLTVTAHYRTTEQAAVHREATQTIAWTVDRGTLAEGQACALSRSLCVCARVCAFMCVRVVSCLALSVHTLRRLFHVNLFFTLIQVYRSCQLMCSRTSPHPCYHPIKQSSTPEHKGGLAWNAVHLRIRA